MPLPTYDHFIEPILRFLAAHPDGATASESHEEVAKALGLSETQRQETIVAARPHTKTAQTGRMIG